MLLQPNYVLSCIKRFVIYMASTTSITFWNKFWTSKRILVEETQSVTLKKFPFTYIKEFSIFACETLSRKKYFDVNCNLSWYLSRYEDMYIHMLWCSFHEKDNDMMMGKRKKKNWTLPRLSFVHVLIDYLLL